MSSIAYGRSLIQSVHVTTTLLGIRTRGRTSRLRLQQSFQKFAGSVVRLKVAKGVVTLIINAREAVSWKLITRCLLA